MRVSIIGAGNVGSTAALFITTSGLADVVLCDIAGDLAKAKALDISHALAALGSDSLIEAGGYEGTADSDIVVVTAGLPRKPGMSRDDLLAKNTQIVTEVVENIKKASPASILLIVTNPLDVMTHLALKTSGFDKQKVLGMAGVLDSARFRQQLSEAVSTKRTDIDAVVLGTHGDTMVPALSQTKISGKPITDSMKENELNELIERTKKSGAEIVSLLKTGSAYYGPGASIFRMCECILKDTKETLCASAYLDGEYGIKDVCLGIPVQLGRAGIEKIIELDLTKEESESLRAAASSVRANIDKA